jgi:hypothetical protein
MVQVLKIRVDSFRGRRGSSLRIVSPYTKYTKVDDIERRKVKKYG